LAVSEARAKIIQYAYDGADGKGIILSISIKGNKPALTIRDFGKKSDLSRYTPPNLEGPPEPGYGVHLILKVMGEAEYDTSPPEGTVLRMAEYRREKR